MSQPKWTREDFAKWSAKLLYAARRCKKCNRPVCWFEIIDEQIGLFASADVERQHKRFIERRKRMARKNPELKNCYLGDPDGIVHGC